TKALAPQASRPLPSSAPASPAPTSARVAHAPVPSAAPRPRRHRQGAAPQPGSPDAASKTGDRYELDPKRFPVLASIGRNLTAAAARGELDPVLGREEEIDRTPDVLANRHGN